MDNQTSLEISDLYRRWYSIAKIISDGTNPKRLKKLTGELIKDTKGFIKKARYQNDC